MIVVKSGIPDTNQKNRRDDPESINKVGMRGLSVVKGIDV